MPLQAAGFFLRHLYRVNVSVHACTSFLRPESFLDTLRLARIVEMRCMQETPVSQPLEVSEPPEGGTRRRIVEQLCDFSQIDFSQPEIRQALRGAYWSMLCALIIVLDSHGI